jgi:hypothetical protein
VQDVSWLRASRPSFLWRMGERKAFKKVFFVFVVSGFGVFRDKGRRRGPGGMGPGVGFGGL